MVLVDRKPEGKKRSLRERKQATAQTAKDADGYVSKLRARVSSQVPHVFFHFFCFSFVLYFVLLTTAVHRFYFSSSTRK